MLNNSVDGKLDHQQHVNVFVDWKQVKFQKSYNFPGNTNFKRLPLDLLNIKLKLFVLKIRVSLLFLLSIQYENIPPLEQVFNKGKHKNIAGLPQPVSPPQLILVHCIYLAAININPYQLQLHLLAAGSFTESHFQELVFNRAH